MPVFAHLIGNLTQKLPKSIENVIEYQTLVNQFPRKCTIDDEQSIIPYRHYNYTIPNDFAKLKFVSCSS